MQLSYFFLNTSQRWNVRDLGGPYILMIFRITKKFIPFSRTIDKLDDGVARGVEGLSLLECEETRNQIVNELDEVKKLEEFVISKLIGFWLFLLSWCFLTCLFIFGSCWDSCTRKFFNLLKNNRVFLENSLTLTWSFQLHTFLLSRLDDETTENSANIYISGFESRPANIASVGFSQMEDYFFSAFVKF